MTRTIRWIGASLAVCLAVAFAGPAGAASVSRKTDLLPSYYSGDLSQFAVGDLADLPIPAVKVVPASAPLKLEDRLARYFRHQDASVLGPYSFNTFADQTASVPWDIAGIYAVSSAYGFLDWKWGTSKFYFHSDGWFGQDTYSLGMDKLGHAFTTYLYTERLTQRILQESDDPRGAAITAALLAMSAQTYVEVMDGFSTRYGFSYEDFAMDGIGAAFSVLRSAFPELARKVDFRLEYVPSGNTKFDPTGDYSGQKYVLALKLSGFDRFEHTPLRFVELQAGYFARGFTKAERNRGEPRRREPYVGIGINLQPLFDGSDTAPALAAQQVLQYIQIPYTYLATKQK